MAALPSGLQSLPEGFSAFREPHALGLRCARRTLLTMLSLISIGPVYSLSASLLAALGAITLFACGGTLYLALSRLPGPRRNRACAGTGRWWLTSVLHLYEDR